MFSVKLFLIMNEVYHLKLTKEKIKEASFAILTGDPKRVSRISDNFKISYGEIAFSREFRTYLVEYLNTPILIISTGIGGSSTSIVMEELARIGIKTFIRIGTSGAIQEYLKTSDIIITTGSVRLDGASIQYAPIEYPALADYEIVNALVLASKKLNLRFYKGITVSTATFYQGQERYDTYLGYIIRDFQNTKEEWRRLNALNYEMESATILTLSNIFGLRAGCVTSIVSERNIEEKINEESLYYAEDICIKVGVEAIKKLIEKWVSGDY